MQLTQDIKPTWQEPLDDWLKIIRSLQSKSRSGGCSILEVRVAVNADGHPMCWSSPKVTHLEPKATCNIDELLDLLCEG